MQQGGRNHNLLNVALAMETLRKNSQGSRKRWESPRWCREQLGMWAGIKSDGGGRGRGEEGEGKQERETIRTAPVMVRLLKLPAF